MSLLLRERDHRFRKAFGNELVRMMLIHETAISSFDVLITCGGLDPQDAVGRIDIERAFGT